jgi:DNA-binding NarL/FixJ family response regulator
LRARVIIVDDHPIVRLGLAHMLTSEPGIEVTGVAGCAAEAHALISRGPPDAVVLDLSLGDDDGMELARTWLQAHPDLRILVLSMQDPRLFAERLLAMGVMAFLNKNCSRDELLSALRAALRGDVWVKDRDVARARPNQTVPDDLLSSREVAVLRMLAAGSSTAAIASALDMAPKTVYSHRRNISAKLGIDSGRELLRYAIQWFRSTA